MQGLTQPVGVIAIGACVLAIIALITVALLSLKLRQLKTAQETVLGGASQTDLTQHAAQLHHAFEQLHSQVEESAFAVEQHLQGVEDRLNEAFTYRALVKYDAYGEMSGHQSSSLALLDARQNGFVISSIVNRDSVRVYTKQVFDGVGEHQLSPEEDRAIALAINSDPSEVILSS